MTFDFDQELDRLLQRMGWKLDFFIWLAAIALIILAALAEGRMEEMMLEASMMVTP